MCGDGMMFFSSWESLGRIFVVGILAYAGLVLLLRVSGKRTLSKMNAFDFVVTVALGSTLATILLSKDTSLADGMVALALLICLQYIVAWTTVRSQWVERVVKSEPALLVHRGRILESALRRERVTQEEVLSAIRAQGMSALADVAAVVLETDGTFSVLHGPEKEQDATSLAGVKGAGTAAPDALAEDDATLG